MFGIFISLSLWSAPTLAYIDPGSGSAIASAIIGLFVAIGLAIKSYWYKFKSLFRGKPSNGDSNRTETEEQEDHEAPPGS